MFLKKRPPAALAFGRSDDSSPVLARSSAACRATSRTIVRNGETSALERECWTLEGRGVRTFSFFRLFTRARKANTKGGRALERSGLCVRSLWYIVSIHEWMDQNGRASRRAVMRASTKRTRVLERAAGESQLPQAPAK